MKTTIKFRVILFLLLLLFFDLVSCQNNDGESELETPSLNFSINTVLPHNTDTLKIFAIGNSFTEDAMSNIPKILKKMGVGNVVLGFVNYKGCSLSQHYQNFASDSNPYAFFLNKSESDSWTITPTYTLKKALQYTDWDIIILQQASDDAGRYETFQPYLNLLLNELHKFALNKNVIFGWHMTWAYGKNSTHPGFKKYNNNQEQMYNSIVNATKTLMKDTGIKLVIPSGTAIQNLRTSKIDPSSLDLTRDGYHSNLAVGRYTLSYLWIEELIVPCLNLDASKVPYYSMDGNIPLSSNNYRTCQDAAQKALSKPFSISE